MVFLEEDGSNSYDVINTLLKNLKKPKERIIL